MKEIEKAINWFENIADGCDKITSGNVAHLRAQIKGMAIRSAEYLKKHSQEPASEDLEQAAIDYDSCRPALYGEDDEGDYVEYIEVRKDAFIAGAEWQREQMMKDAIDGEVNIWCSHISFPKVLPPEFSKQRVKVIIIKE